MHNNEAQKLIIILVHVTCLRSGVDSTGSLTLGLRQLWWSGGVL